VNPSNLPLAHRTSLSQYVRTQQPWRLLKTQGGRCPLCGDTLLYADREPNCPREWEEWFTAVRKAITRHNLAVSADPDTPEDTRIRLVHSTCQRRTSKGASSRNGNVIPLHRS
jgi:RNA-directed DNA polymerase